MSARRCQAPSLSPSTGTRSPGAADVSSRDVSVLDTDSQAGDEDALDFFQQQDQVEDEGLPTLGHQDGDAGKSSEEEEALDPLGIMRYVSPSGWGAPHLACSGLLPLSWGSEKTHLPRSSLSTQGDWLSVHPQHLLGLWGWAQVSSAPPWSQGGPPAFYRGLAACHPNPDTSAAQAS